MKRIKESYYKTKNLSPAAKASMALLLSNFALKGISLISGPIFTRIMTTEQYGIVSTFTSWKSILSVIITLNLSMGVFNNGMMDFREKRDAFQMSLIAITSSISLLFLCVFLLFRQRVTEFLDMPEALVYILFLHFFTVPAYTFWSGRQRYEYKYKAITIITIGNALLSLGIGVAAVLNCNENYAAIARVCSIEGVSIVIGFVLCIYTAIKSNFEIRFDYCMYALKFNIPLLPHYLSMHVLASSDRIMIKKMIDASATAIYSVAYTAAMIINIFWQSTEASLSPWIYEKLREGHESEVRKLTGKIVIAFGVICVTCTLFAPEIMAILAPAEYYEGVFVIPSVAAGVFFTAIYSLYMRLELFYRQTGFAPIATSIAALLNVLLNYIFISLFGFIAAGYTTMICYALLALLHYLNVKRKGYSNILNNKLFLLTAICMISISIFITAIYSYTVIRVIIILIILFLIYKNRGLIKTLLKR